MTRKDFILVAETINNLPVISLDGMDLTEAQKNRIRMRVAEAFADALPATNDRFQRGRFLNACEG